MEETVTSITWEALEHTHQPKGADWFWVLGIITLAVSVAAIVLGNTLFGILVLVAGVVTGIASRREAKVIAYAITTRGVRIDSVIYPYSTLDSFFIDEQNPSGPQLLLKVERIFMPLLVIPLPPEDIDEIEALIAARLPEERLEEPIAHKFLEFFGF